MQNHGRNEDDDEPYGRQRPAEEGAVVPKVSLMGGGRGRRMSEGCPKDVRTWRGHGRED